MASTSLRISISLRCSTAIHREPFSVGHSWSSLTNCFLTRQHPLCSTTLKCSARRRRSNDATSITPNILNKKKLPRKNVEEDNDIDEDAFDALFHQLEEDLKNDDLLGNDGEDDEISEEEFAKLELELAEALEDDDELVAAFQSIIGGEVEDEEKDEEEEEKDHVIDIGGDEVDEEDEEAEIPMKLKNWQIRRLAYALKNGRRKTKIKFLAAELFLDRAIVLKLLRDPPPNLLLMSATLPDKPVSTILEPVENPILETIPLEMDPQATNSEVEKKVPVHVMQSNWTAGKRLKKVQVETLELVYRRTKRPTNTMISSIVHVTNLPQKRVVKWFEDKRVEDGVPENRIPYQKSDTIESIFTS